jgi:hypothetical protein
MSATALLLPLALGAGPGTAQLERAKALYADLQYERCLQTTADALKTSADHVERAELLVTEGLCEVQLRKTVSAQQSFEQALRESPQVVLPRFAPPAARSLFAAVRADLERGPAVEAPPPAPPPVERAPSPAEKPEAQRSLAPDENAKRAPAPERTAAPAETVKRPTPPAPAPVETSKRASVLPPPRAEAQNEGIAAAPAPVAARAEATGYSPWPLRVGLGSATVLCGFTSAALLGSAHTVADRYPAEQYWQTRQSLATEAYALQTASVVSLVLALSALVMGVGHELWLRW